MPKKILEEAANGKRERQRKNHANQEGFEQYLPDLKWEERCEFVDPILRKEYSFGWERGQRQWREDSEKESCPICGSVMDEFLSGLYCSNDINCKYHIHKEV